LDKIIKINYDPVSYNSKSIKQVIIKLGYIPHVPYKRKRGQKENTYKKKYPFGINKRLVVKRTNS
jgi:hypothetical protein